MTLRDIQILAYSRPSRRIKHSLVRVASDPFPDNFALWDRTALTWVRRRMTRREAQSWCQDNDLPDMTRGADDGSAA